MSNKTPQSPKIKVGQILYSENKGAVQEWKVLKVGAKYIHIINQNYEERQIDKKTLSVKSNNGVFLQFYLTAQEVYDEVKRCELERKVRSEFSLFSLAKKPRVFTMEELMAICEILKLDK